MKIIVLGGGLVGSVMAADLSKNHEVTCADLNSEVLNSIESKLKIKTVQCDFSNAEEIKKTIAPFDLVIGAVPGFLGFEMLKAVIEAGKNIADISFFPEDPFLLDELAKKNNVTAVVDCGVAPGMCNVIAGYHNQQMKINSYECLVGGLPVVRIKPYEYKAPFSPVDVLEEYTRPARYVENGKLVTKEALTDIEEINFEHAGTLEAFNTDGLRSLAVTMPHIPNMIEKTLRYPGHAILMRGFRETGFFSKEKIKVKNAEVAPIDLVSKLLFSSWKYQPGEEDFTIMRVTIEGVDKEGSVKYIYSLYDRYDKATGIMSMARTTGYTCTAVAQLILGEKIQRKGIIPPEFIGESQKGFDFVMTYLKERNVIYSREEIRS
jgi:saccharopine dehydrogenase-like NADP-dependent oxidoreductase